MVRQNQKTRNRKEYSNDNGRGGDNKQIKKQVQERITEKKDKMDKRKQELYGWQRDSAKVSKTKKN